MKPQNWNDVLALLLMGSILYTWVFRVNVDGEANGALIAVFTMVAQYYFRKAKTEK